MWCLAGFCAMASSQLFPDDAVVEDLIAVGIGLAVPLPRTICISGSSAALGSEIAIGDLDFCQYVPLPPASIFEVAATFRAPATNRVMLTASYGTSKNAGRHDHRGTNASGWGDGTKDRQNHADYRAP